MMIAAVFIVYVALYAETAVSKVSPLFLYLLPVAVMRALFYHCLSVVHGALISLINLSHSTNKVEHESKSVKVMHFSSVSHSHTKNA